MPDPHGINAAEAKELVASHCKFCGAASEINAIGSNSLITMNVQHSQQQHNWLTMQSLPLVVSIGTAVISLQVVPGSDQMLCVAYSYVRTIRDYCGAKLAEVQQLCNGLAAERLTCIGHACHKQILLPQENEIDMVCTVVSALHFEDHLAEGSWLFLLLCLPAYSTHHLHRSSLQLPTLF